MNTTVTPTGSSRELGYRNLPLVRKLSGFARWARRPEHVDAMLLLAMSTLVTALWFQGGSLAVGGDVGSVPIHPSQMAGEYLSPWNFWGDTGNSLPMIISNQVPPIDFLFYMVGEQVGLSVIATEQLYTILFSYFLGAYSTYLLLRILFGDREGSTRIAALSAGAFWILNPVYVYSQGFLSILSSPVARASLPLALFLLIAGLKRRDMRYAFGLGIASLLLFSVFPRAMEIGFFLTFAAILAVPYVDFLRKHRDFLKFVAKFLTGSFLVALAVNLFWIVPFTQNIGTLTTKLAVFPTSFIYFESQFTTLPNVLRLQGFWTLYVGTYVPYASYYVQPIVILATFALPIIVLSAFLRLPKWEPERLGLALLLVLFLGLAMGTNLPFGLFEGLIAWVPFFKLFKDPWVFLEALALVYALLFGLSIGHFAKRLAATSHHRWPSRLVAVGVALLVLGTISAPVLNGTVFTNWYQPSQRGVKVPADYAALNDWIGAQSCDCAMLLVPELRGAYMSTNWGYQGANAFYHNLLPGRLITGSGSLYGLQSPDVATFVSYAYTLMAFGDPVYHPLPLNESLLAAHWLVSGTGEAAGDGVNSSAALTPWNTTSVAWQFGATNGGLGLDHSAVFTPGTPLDLTTTPWLDLWIESSIDLGNFVLQVHDAAGNSGWYSLTEHVLFKEGAWTLVAVPTEQPDSFNFSQSSVTALGLTYVAPSAPQSFASGGGSVLLGPFELSQGRVPQGLIQYVLRDLNVGYVILDRSVNNQLYPFQNPLPYARTLANLTNVTEVKQFGNLTVYENGNPGALISIPSGWVGLSNVYDLATEFSPALAAAGGGTFILEPNADMTQQESSARLVSVNRQGSSSFSAQVEARGRFLAVLSTSYDPSWVALVNGQPAESHVVAGGYANGWMINATGNITISFEFERAIPFFAGMAISALSITVVSLALIVGPKRVLRVFHRLRARIGSRAR